MHQNVVQRSVEVQIIYPSAGLHVEDVDDVYLLVDGCFRPGVQILGSFKGVLAVGCTLPDELFAPLSAFGALWPGACYGHVVLLGSGIKGNHILRQKFRRITFFR